MNLNFAYRTYVSELKRALRGCDSFLDLGCGASSPAQYVKKKYSVGVDGFAKSIRASKMKNLHDSYKLMDVRKISKGFKPKSFDAVIALDLIEHLPKKQGDKLISDMERIAAKRVVIFTPNGFVRQFDKDNDLEEHVSGWSIRDFKKRGYKVKGVYGWKPLRGEKAELKFKPKILSGLLSEATHYLFTKYNPSYSYSLLAVKELA